MNSENMLQARRTPDGRLEEILPDGTTRPLQGETDWAQLEAMTEEEAYQNALDDPDNPPRTTDELARMRRVPNPRRLRQRLGLTQREFAILFEIPLSAIRDWEEGVRMPDGTAITYLRLIERNPDAVRAILRDASPVGAKTA